MSVELTYDLKISVAETPALSLDSGTDPTITRATTTSGKWTGSTSTPVTKNIILTDALTAGTATIDLTSMTDGVLGTKDFTGLKVQAYKITNPSTNTAALLVEDGATNGYNIFGAATRAVSVLLGQVVASVIPDQMADVSATVKTIDLTSTDLDADYTIELVAG